MNKLIRYKKLENLIKRLDKEQKEMRIEIINQIKALPGRNENKELIEGEYVATVTYAKSVTWDVDKAEELFLKLGKKECLTIKVDNKIVEAYEKKGILDSKKIDELRTIAYDTPKLYVKNIEEK